MTGQSFWVSDESRACLKNKTAGISPTGGLIFSLNLFGELEEGETILASTPFVNPNCLGKSESFGTPRLVAAPLHNPSDILLDSTYTLRVQMLLLL